MIRKILGCFFVVIIISTIAVGTIFWQANRFWLQSPKSDAEMISFIIQEGEGLSAIANALEERDIVKSAFWFKVYTKISGDAKNVQAGEFKLKKRMNYASIVEILIDAESTEIQVTIPEGYTLAQIGEVVTKNFDISTSAWNEATGIHSSLNNHPFIVSSQKPSTVDLEGYLFPDTYRFFEDASVEEIVRKMIDEMEENVQESDVSLGLREGGPETMHEFLTLASIVEREVRAQDEMNVVAGIFYNRLEIGMALQADSTVNYVTGKDTPGISLEDTELDSLYNTYKHPGLPPGPISNPGRNALTASAHPASTSYFYFLTSPEGEVFYASTNDQHVKNKNRYLR